MTSFVNMFIPARYSFNDKRQCTCSALILDCVLIAAGWSSSILQTKNINKLRTLIFHQLTMSLLVIDFKYLEGRDGDIVVKELVAVDFQSTKVVLCVFKKPYGCEELPMFNT